MSPQASLSYNEAVALRMRGRLDVDALRAALTDLVARHEALRTTFAADGTTLVVSESSTPPCEVLDLTHLPAAESAARIDQLRQEVVTTPFVLETGPLVRVWIALISAEESVVVFAAHHIVCDGWSTGVLMRDWGMFYSARVGQGSAPKSAACAFADYAISRREDVGRDNESYWVSRFTGTVPTLDLPTDRPRPSMRTQASLREDLVLSESLVSAVKRAGAKERASLFGTLLAAFKGLLFRLSGQRDMVVGIPAAGQSVEGYEELVGHCISMLPLRDSIDPNAPFVELLRSVQTTLLDALEHHPYTLGSLLARLPIARDPSRLPLVSVLFNVDREMGPELLPFAHLHVELAAVPRRFENYELFVNAVEQGGKVVLECQFNCDLFDASTVRGWLVAYEGMLTAIAANPQCRVADLPLPAGVVTLSAPVAKPVTIKSAAATVFQEPATPTEVLVAKIWQDVLGAARVSVTDDFFELGGHSLLAAKMLSRLARDHGVALALPRVFEAPTVRELAAIIDGGRKDQSAAAAVITKRADPRRARQSLMQQRLWFLEQMEQGQRVFNLPAAFRLGGALDLDALERALSLIVLRHEPMRTTLSFENGEPIQNIAEPSKVSLPVEDLSRESSPDDRIMERLRELTDVPFDLTRGPLFAARVLRLREDDHVLFFMPHHAVWDGWSFDTFLTELDLAYGAFAKGRTPELPVLAISYADFAEWHLGWLEGDELEKQSSYWKKKLSGEISPLEMPTDRPRPPEMTGLGGFVALTLSHQEIQALRAVAQSCGSTVYMLIVTAWAALLHRYTGQTDLLIGTPVRGRTQPQTENLVGFFVNTLVLRVNVEGDPSMRELATRVRTTCLEAFAHPDMPFELLVKELGLPRDLSRTPIFQAFFSFQDATDRPTRVGDLELGQLHVMPNAAQNDLVLWVMERKDGAVGGLSYNADIFDRTTIERMLAQLRTLLTEMIKDVEQPTSTIAILPEDEVAMLDAWNATDMTFDRAARAHDLFEAQARTTPDAIAVIGADRSLKYGELDRQSNRIARALRELGIKRGALVGLCVERTPLMIAALLGILKAGGAYVPLAPGFPDERLRFMVEDSAAKVIVGDGDLARRLADGRALLLLDDHIDAYSDAPLPHDEASATADSPAYVIYTSGSTGKPKGVVVPHGAVANFLVTITDRPGISRDDTLLAVTTLSFDIAVLEIYGPLSVGGRVVVATREEASDGRTLLDAIQKHGVTIMQATPSTWRLLIEAGLGKSRLKALCGGEALPPDLAVSLSERTLELWNLYGPTETTVWSTRWRVPSIPSRVLIGSPIGNTQCHVIDARGQRTPIGVPGELCIGGAGVTTGYLGRPELTAERFVADPFTSGRMYRTGDVVRWLASGEIEYVGRNDNQVKVRGYRIELGEIDARIAELPSVLEACTTLIVRAADDVRLVAYFVHRPGQSITQTELRKHLRGVLPDYMVPQHFVELAALPRTPNNKIDRKALPPPFAEESKSVGFIAPRTPNEELLADLWKSALGVASVGVHDNFFNAGGHSLLVLQVMAEIEKHTGGRISPRSFVLDTLEQMAAQLPQTQKVSHTPPQETKRTLTARLFDRLKDKLR